MGMNDIIEESNIAKRFMPCVLRRYRDAAGLSQQALADRIGIDKSYVSSLGLGYCAPNLNLLVKLAGAMNVRLGELVDAMVADAQADGTEVSYS